ncbi:YkgJ family cysteine cluster protein [Acidovorax sp.]|uniref:YkgJ family cysteine cluster protein n=1 Tax=Acidovorax sp. TaxID=1872122 RepID=UPI0039188946
MSESAHPCLACGACCASFRVDFAVYEMVDMGGTVPTHLAMDVNGSTCRMRGTEQVPIRCVALTGEVGAMVACSIYDARPTPCREFTAGDYACHKARARHGLAPLGEQPHN